MDEQDKTHFAYPLFPTGSPPVEPIVHKHKWTFTVVALFFTSTALVILLIVLLFQFVNNKQAGGNSKDPFVNNQGIKDFNNPTTLARDIQFRLSMMLITNGDTSTKVDQVQCEPTAVDHEFACVAVSSTGQGSSTTVVVAPDGKTYVTK